MNAGDEDDRLLDGHRRAGDLLVEQVRPSPDRRARLVEAVERIGDEREQQAERAGQDERGEKVGGLRDRVGATVDDRPPECEPGHEVRRVLEVEDRVRMTQREVVHGRHVPEEVRPEPCDERGKQRHVDAPPERVRERQDEQRRRPLRDRHVLEEVRGEQPVECKRLDRGREDARAAGVARRRSRRRGGARNRMAARGGSTRRRGPARAQRRPTRPARRTVPRALRYPPSAGVA